MRSPPFATSAGQTPLSENMRSFRRTFTLGFLSALLLGSVTAHAASLSLDRGPVVLGRTESVGVTIRLEELPGTEDRPLRLATNVGSFSDVTRTGPGVYRTVFVPPSTRFPQVALVAVWRETGPDAPIEFLRIPLYGRTQLPLSGRKDSEIEVLVGLDSYGPLKVDKKGNAQVTIDVPPSINEATINLKEKSGATTKRNVPIQVPPYNRLTAAIVPKAMVADGKSWARVEVFYDLGGASVPADRIQVSVPSGSLTFQRAERGRYVYKYVPRAGTSETEIPFKVKVEGDNTAIAGARLQLGLPPPARVLVRAPDKPIPADGVSTARVSVLVFDEEGLGLPAEDMELTANGSPLKGLIHDGDGAHTATFTAPSSYPSGGLVQFVARLKGTNNRPVTASVNYQLEAPPSVKEVIARFSPSPVPADGRTPAELVLDVRDPAGLPLENAQLILVASHGTLGPLAEISKGLYRAAYTGPDISPEGETLVRIVDSAGEFETRIDVPLRADPKRLLVGVRGGYTHSLATLGTPRAGLDVLVPFRVGSALFGLGLTATGGQTVQRVSDGALESRSEALFAPVSARLSYELYAGRASSVSAGAGAMATLARFKTSLTGEEASGIGVGGLGFVQAGWRLGPGQLFAELGYAYAPVSAGSFRLDAGGALVEAGYRLGVF